MKRTGAAAVSLYLALIAPAFPAAGEMVVQSCFSPQGKCSTHIVREIERAKQELLVAVYAFTSVPLAGAVAEAKKRGLAVRVIVDREFDRANDNSKARFLESQGVAVRRISGMVSAVPPGREPGLMHQKFAVIDRRLVFTGSYNWTHSADNRNDENLLVFRNAGPLAEEYRIAFSRLWERK